jgi:hypothetical protein
MLLEEEKGKKPKDKGKKSATSSGYQAQCANQSQQ